MAIDTETLVDNRGLINEILEELEKEAEWVRRRMVTRPSEKEFLEGLCLGIETSINIIEDIYY